jgi:hypothetical protein
VAVALHRVEDRGGLAAAAAVVAATGGGRQMLTMSPEVMKELG